MKIEVFLLLLIALTLVAGVTFWVWIISNVFALARQALG
jgi:uncharacterized membrane protein YecN with MAPEG domain